MEALAGSGPIVLLDVAPDGAAAAWWGQNPAAAGRADREEKFLVLYRRVAGPPGGVGTGFHRAGVSPQRQAERVLTVLKGRGPEESAKMRWNPDKIPLKKRLDKRG